MARLPHFEPIYTSVGSTRKWRIQIRDANNLAPVDLTSGTITIDVLDSQLWAGEDFDAPDSEWNSINNTGTGDELKVEAGACVIVTATSGIVTYAPVAADVDTPGRFYFQCKAVLSDGSILHWPPRWLWDRVHLLIGPGLSDLR